MRRRSRRALGLALAAVAAAPAGCADGLAFRRDERVRFLAPPDRAEVRAPVVIRWRARGLAGRRFAVFVDRPPMPPGRTVADLAREDPLCRRAAGCPDRRWLERNWTFLTRESRLVLPALPSGGGRRVGDRRLHEVTLVALDGRGARTGEAAWAVTFFGPPERPR